MDPEADVGSDQGRPDVERSIRLGRHPLVLQADQLGNRLDVLFRVHLGHGHPCGRAIEAGGVLPWPEQVDLPVRPPIRLETFEDLLAVVEDHGGGIQDQRSVGADPGVVPPLFRGVALGEHAVAEVAAEAQVRRGGLEVARLQGFDGDLHGHGLSWGVLDGPQFSLRRHPGRPIIHPLLPRRQDVGVHYSIRRQMRYDRQVIPHPVMTQGELRHARETS